MAYAVHGDGPIPNNAWKPAGQKAGADGLSGAAVVMVGHLTCTAFKFMYVGSDGDVNYYRHKANIEEPSAFRQVCSYCVRIEVGATSQGDQWDIKVFGSLSGTMLLIMCNVKTSMTMSKLRFMIRDALAENNIVSMQADVKITDPIASGRAKLCTACKGRPDTQPTLKKCITRMFNK